MRNIAFLPLFALTACQQNAKPAATPPPAAQTWEEFQRTRPDTFIQSYEASLAAEAARLRAAGLAEDLAYVRAQVDAHLPPGDYTLQATGANAAVLRRLRVDATANRLVSYGYRARHFATPQQARSLVRAGADLFGEVDALVLVSPIVLVADRDRIDKKADGSAELVFRVSEAIKSSPPLGSEFRLTLNGPMPPVSGKPGDPPPPPPPPNPAMWELNNYKSVLFFFQPRATVVTRSMATPDRPALLFAPMPINGEQVLPGYHSGTQPTTLAAVRSAARAQLCSPGYVPVSPGANLPLSC